MTTLCRDRSIDHQEKQKEETTDKGQGGKGDKEERKREKERGREEGRNEEKRREKI